MELGLQEMVHQAVMQDRSGSITMEILSKSERISGEVPIPELKMVPAWIRMVCYFHKSTSYKLCESLYT